MANHNKLALVTFSLYALFLPIYCEVALREAEDKLKDAQLREVLESKTNEQAAAGVTSTVGSAIGVPPTAGEWPYASNTKASRIIAVGDTHGDLFQFMATLSEAGVIDFNGSWTGHDSVVIQLGDIFDRGPEGRYIVDYMKKLDAEARVLGGAVVTMMGNHEAMNLCGWLHYVAPEDFDLFGGKVARKAAFGKDGIMGSWVRKLPIALRVNDTVFAHAGILPKWGGVGVAKLNELSHKAIEVDEPKCEEKILRSDGPVWTRDLVKPDCPLLEQSLQALSKAEGVTVRRMVVGHTPDGMGRVRMHCGGALVAVDIAMSKWMVRKGLPGHIGALQLTPSTAEGESEPHWTQAKTIPESVTEAGVTRTSFPPSSAKKLKAHFNELWKNQPGGESLKFGAEDL